MEFKYDGGTGERLNFLIPFQLLDLLGPRRT